MKVLHIAQILQGGTASHLCELIALQNRDWGVGAVTVLGPGDQIAYLAALDQRQLRTFASSARSPRALWRFAQAARLAIRQVDPDIIHLHGTFAGFVVRLVALVDGKSRRPTVYCAHGWSFNMRVSPLVRAAYGLLERVLARRTDRVICISAYEEQTAKQRKLPAARLTTVYNGIADCDSALLCDPPATPGLRLLFIGRDCRQKGFDTLALAMERLSGVPITLEAIGPEHRPGLAPNITARGWLDRREVPHRVAHAHALVMPSRWEGFGLAALEAMRQGRAVIASAVDALPELVVHGETGLLVPPDDPVALAEVLRKLTRNDARRMGVLGRQRFLAHFTAAAMHERIARIYAQVLN